MKSVHELVRENRKETVKFLEGQPNQHFTFVKLNDGDEYEFGDWLDPNNNDEECDVCDVAPFVTYADGDGNITEYIVTDIFIDDEKMSISNPNQKLLCASLINAQDYNDRMEIPFSWLYGVSECYIYEMLKNVANV